MRGDNGEVVQSEPDDGEGAGDQTRISWQVPNPSFTVNPEGEDVWGDQWTPGVSVSVEVFESDQATSKGAAVVGLADGGGSFGVNVSPIDVVPGDYLVVTQSATVKTHTVIDLSVGADADTRQGHDPP